MINYISFRFQMLRLSFKRNKTAKSYNSVVKLAPEDSQERRERSDEAMHFISFIDLQIRELHTDYLRKIANKMILALPNRKDETLWDKPSGYSKSILTNKGIFELKRQIRLEKKEKRDIAFSWISLLIGLLGAAIGLISVLKK